MKPATPMTVRIFHNTTTDDSGRHVGYFGYEPDHTLTEVFAFQGTFATAEDAAERAFWLFNVGDDTRQPEGAHPDAVAYRSRGLRSLSVGDVVLAGDVALACASRGWTRISTPDAATN